jgi:hypothetical protein
VAQAKYLLTDLETFGNIHITITLSSGAGKRIQYSDWLRAGRLEVSSPGKVKNFLFFVLSIMALGPDLLPIQRIPWALSQGVKWPKSKADHSPLTSAEVKKSGFIHPLPHAPS